MQYGLQKEVEKYKEDIDSKFLVVDQPCDWWYFKKKQY